MSELLTHDPRAPLRFEQRPTRIEIAFSMHATFNAETPSVFVFNVSEIGIAGHEIAIWVETTAIHAVAEVELDAAVFVLQAPHLFVAEGADEVIEAPVYKP